MTGIINYHAGNIFSLTGAMDRLGLAYGMVNNGGELERYERIIIPGVGHAGAAMQNLRDTGMVEAITQLEKPVLGICVGMQLLTSHSEEGNAGLMEIVPLKTRLFNNLQGLKVPHMGWNTIQTAVGPLFEGVLPGSWFYFVHSYFIETDPQFTIAQSNYGIDFSAAFRKDNFYGVQFHPEKSGGAGEQILINFSKI